MGMSSMCKLSSGKEGLNSLKDINKVQSGYKQQHDGYGKKLNDEETSSGIKLR